MFFLYTANITVIIPAHGEVMVAGSKWNNNSDNPPLTPRKYYTAFSYTLELNGQFKKLDLEVEFEVQ